MHNQKTNAPKATHPWKLYIAGSLKLKEARKEAKRRYERTSPIRNDEFRRLTENTRIRNVRRAKAGIPLDVPLHTRRTKAEMEKYAKLTVNANPP